MTMGGMVGYRVLLVSYDGDGVALGVLELPVLVLLPLLPDDVLGFGLVNPRRKLEKPRLLLE